MIISSRGVGFISLVAVFAVLMLFWVGCSSEIDPEGSDQNVHRLNVVELGVDPPEPENIRGLERCDSPEECFGAAGPAEWADFTSVFGEGAAFTLNGHLYQLIKDPNTKDPEWIARRRAMKALPPLGLIEEASFGEAKEGIEFVLSEIVQEWPSIFGISHQDLQRSMTIEGIKARNGLLYVSAGQQFGDMSVGLSTTKLIFDENWMLLSIHSWLQPVDEIESWLTESGGIPDERVARRVLYDELTEELGEFDPGWVFEFEPVWMPLHQAGGYRAGVSTSRYPNGEYFFITPVRPEL